MDRRRPLARLALPAVVALVLGLILLPGGQTAAQETIEFRISKYTCPIDPGNVSPAAGNIPDECDPTGGVSFTVAGEAGTVLATCTTDDTGLCIVDVPNEAEVVVTEDESTAPDGYAPRENPISTTAVTEFAGALFINLPSTITPPVVGTGATAAAPAPWSPLLLGLASLALLAGGMVLRRRAA